MLSTHTLFPTGFASIRDLAEWSGVLTAGCTLLVHGDRYPGMLLLHSGSLIHAQMLGLAPVVLTTAPYMARLLSSLGLRVMTSDYEVGMLVNNQPNQFRTVSIDRLPGLIGLTQPIASSAYHEENCYNPRLAALFHDIHNLKIGICWGDTSVSHEHCVSGVLSWLSNNIDCTLYGIHWDIGPFPWPVWREAKRYCHDLNDMAEVVRRLDFVIGVPSLPAHVAGVTRVPGVLIASPQRQTYYGGVRCKWYPTLRTYTASEVTPDLLTTLFANFPPRSVDSPLNPARAEEPSSPPSVAIKQCRYGLLRFYETDHYIGRSLDLYGEFSELEVHLYRRLLSPGSTVIEAGSNVGSLTVALADIVGERGRIHAFEPQQELFTLLEANTKMLPQVTPWLNALSDRQGTLCYSSGDPSKICNPGFCKMTAVDPSNTGHMVSTLSLDSIFPDQLVDLIKADVEGDELSVLMGAEQLIKRARPLLYLEDDDHGPRERVYRWLGERGYNIYRHLPPMFNADNWHRREVNVFGGTVSKNLLAVPRDRVLPWLSKTSETPMWLTPVLVDAHTNFDRNSRA